MPESCAEQRSDADTRTSHLLNGRNHTPDTGKSYKLRCPVCGNLCADDGFVLECPRAHAPGLLTTEYESATLRLDDAATGLFRFGGWLPISKRLPGAGKTVTYQSKMLCALTKLPNLWIAFNGYWPEKGARLLTASFKELEAYTVIARSSMKRDSTLVVASAGNTAAAFALVCSRMEISCLILVPPSAVARLVFCEPIHPKVQIVVLPEGADYTDALTLGDAVAREDGFYPEGGVKNVARRDGIGTTLLDAVSTIGYLPDFYFQAVGSGTGAIAVHETSKRLMRDGRFGTQRPRLWLSQNLPFAPMLEAWSANKSAVAAHDRSQERVLASKMFAPVLSNSKPPYSIAGGVLEALRESKGKIMGVSNHEAQAGAALFEQIEGIDIDPAAGVAVASLLKSVEAKQIDRNATVLLHITGGGWKRRQNEGRSSCCSSAYLRLDSPADAPHNLDLIRQRLCI